MKRAIQLLERTQVVLVVVFLIIMSCSSFFQVLNRNFFKLPISWTEELSRYSMIWMTMIGTCISLRKGTQMSVMLFEKKIKGIWLTILRIFDSLMVMIFSAVVMVSITALIKTQAASGQLSPAMRIPMQYVTVGIFIGMLFFCLFEVGEIIRICRAAAKGDHGDENLNPEQAAEEEE